MSDVKMSDNAKKIADNFNPATNIPYIQFVANKKTENKLVEIEEKINAVLAFIASQKK